MTITQKTRKTTETVKHNENSVGSKVDTQTLEVTEATLSGVKGRKTPVPLYFDRQFRGPGATS